MAKPRFRRDNDNLIAISAKVSKDAHHRLVSATEVLNVGQNHILSVLLETFDFESLRHPLSERLERLRRRPPLSEQEVRAYLQSLTPEQRKSLLDK